MTENLRTLMHERADSVRFDEPDLDRLVATGDRRLRQRRTGLVGGLVVGAAAAVLAGSALTGGERAAEPVTGTEDAAEVSYAIGSVLHHGGEEVDLGHEVRAYVRTASGIVFADPRGRVYSWTGGTDVTAVGRTSARRPRLVSDDESDLAAWIDPTRGQPALAILDRDRVRTMRDHGQNLAAVYALDAWTAYLLDDRGTLAVDLESGETTVLDPSTFDDDLVLDAEDGLVAFSTPEEGGTEIGTRPGTGVQLPEAYGSSGRLSPDATWFSLDGDEPKIYDARTGEPLAFDVGRGFATGYEWLDDSTIAMLAAPEPDTSTQAELITCQVPAATCETVAAQLGTFDELVAQGFALPIGRPIDD